jgi:hypothetical protein
MLTFWASELVSSKRNTDKERKVKNFPPEELEDKENPENPENPERKEKTLRNKNPPFKLLPLKVNNPLLKVKLLKAKTREEKVAKEEVMETEVAEVATEVATKVATKAPESLMSPEKTTNLRSTSLMNLLSPSWARW